MSSPLITLERRQLYVFEGRARRFERSIYYSPLLAPFKREQYIPFLGSAYSWAYTPLVTPELQGSKLFGYSKYLQCPNGVYNVLRDFTNTASDTGNVQTPSISGFDTVWILSVLEE